MKTKVTDINAGGTLSTSTFLRGDGNWAVPPGGGGGGGAAWSLINSWDFALDGAIISRDVSVAGYSDLLVLCDRVALASSSWRTMQLSTDGGSTFWSSSGDYLRYTGNGTIDQSDTHIYFHSTAASGGRTGRVEIWGIDMTGPKLFSSTAGNGGANSVFRASINPITDIRLSNNAGVDMNGGALYVYGR